MLRMNKQLWALLLVLGLWVSAAWTQQKDPQGPPSQPVAPLRESPSKDSSGAANAAGAAPAGTATVPDNRPLSSVEQYGLGSEGTRRNIFLMGFQFREIGDTNSSNTSSGTDIDSASLLSGNIALRHLWRHSELDAAYAGGGALYNTRSDLNQTFHQVGLTERASWRRWALLLSDQASYLPESSFGYGGLNPLSGIVPGAGGLGGQFSNINPVLDPSQSILTALARRISNSVAGEVQYSITRRSSFTAAASYGLLHYLDDGFIDNYSLGVRSGYNYALNSRDTLGVVYTFTRFTFGQQTGALQNHAAQLAYGRRLTGRLALELYAGPQVNTFEDVSGNPAPQVTWSAGAYLRYQLPRGGVGLSYLHGTSGGAGIFAGAQRDEVQAFGDRKLSRRWTANVNFGYARNTALQEILLIPINSKYDSWYAGAALNHILNRQMNLFFTYNFQRQETNSSLCTTVNCAISFLRHQFGLGFNWNLRQSGID